MDKIIFDKQYHSNGVVSYEKKTDFYDEVWYDEQGRPVRLIDADGQEHCWKYSEAGLTIQRLDNDGNKYIEEYDTNGNLIYQKEPDREFGVVFDVNGSTACIWTVDSLPRIPCIKVENKEAKTIYRKVDEIEHWFKYDEYGNCIHEYASNDVYEKMVYDENHRIICKKNQKGIFSWYEYRKDGTLKKILSSDGIIFYFDKGSQPSGIWFNPFLWFKKKPNIFE